MTLHFSCYITYNCSIMGIDLFKSNLQHERRSHVVARFIFIQIPEIQSMQRTIILNYYIRSLARSYPATIFRIPFISAQRI